MFLRYNILAQSLFCITFVACVRKFKTNFTNTSTRNNSNNESFLYVDNAIKSLEKVLDFFQMNYVNVNLDAVIGTRIVEGTLQILLQNIYLKNVITLQHPIVDTITATYLKSKRVSDISEKIVSQNQRYYYQRIGRVTNRNFWKLNYTQRKLPKMLSLWPYVPVEAMSEEESDDCITELFDTNGQSNGICAITDNCWVKMTAFGYSQYSLTHEIFYLQLAEMMGCEREIKWQIAKFQQKNLYHLQDIFCSNMLREATLIAYGGFAATHQDLFMEQVALCGMYGYWEFFRYSWLDNILSWQDSTNGCYKWDAWPQHRLVSSCHHRWEKREEHRLDNGCLCHRTAVAAGALAQYIRFLVENLTMSTNH